jgi:hypothetical protein
MLFVNLGLMAEKAPLYAEPPIVWAVGIYFEDVKMRFLMASSFSALPSLPKTSTLRQNSLLALCHSISGAN